MAAASRQVNEASLTQTDSTPPIPKSEQVDLVNIQQELGIIRRLAGDLSVFFCARGKVAKPRNRRRRQTTTIEQKIANFLKFVESLSQRIRHLEGKKSKDTAEDNEGAEEYTSIEDAEEQDVSKGGSTPGRSDNTEEQSKIQEDIAEDDMSETSSREEVAGEPLEDEEEELDAGDVNELDAGCGPLGGGIGELAEKGDMQDDAAMESVNRGGKGRTEVEASAEEEAEDGDVSMGVTEHLIAVAGANAPEDAEQHAAPTYAIPFHDVIGHNEAVFDEICNDRKAQDYGYVKVELDAVPSFGLDAGTFKQPTDGQNINFRYVPDKYLVKVEPLPDQRVSYPGFPLPQASKKDRPKSELKSFLEKAITGPAMRADYVIGNPTFPLTDAINLRPGKKLERRGDKPIEGINTPYMYFAVSEKTVSIVHCEDFDLGSKNVVLSGSEKVLLV
jgi:hypothetical protein